MRIADDEGVWVALSQCPPDRLAAEVRELRKALSSAQADCAALRFRLNVEERANETIRALLDEAKAGAK